MKQPREVQRVVPLELKDEAIQAKKGPMAYQGLSGTVTELPISKLSELEPYLIRRQSDIDSFLLPDGAPVVYECRGYGEYSNLPNQEKTAAILKDIPFHLGVDLSTVHLYSKPAGKAAVLVAMDQPGLNSDSAWERIAELSNRFSLPVKVIGRASNMMFGERDVSSIVVQHQYWQVEQELQFGDGQIIAEAAVSLPHLVNQAAEQGFDLSFLAGIPGTLGGACIGNAGRTKTDENIGSLIRSVQIFDLETGRSEWLDPGDDKWNGSFFVQRGSVLKQENLPHTQKIVRKLVLNLSPERVGSQEARARIQSSMDERFEKNKEAINEKTAGSFWANGILPEVLMRDQQVVRDLLVEAGVADLDICGARYTPEYRFLSTSEETRDRHVALLMELTRRAFNERWGFVPRQEVDIYGSEGSLKDEQFINNALSDEDELSYPGL